MKPNMIIRKWIVLMAAATLAGSGCVFDSGKEANRGTVVDNEVRVGFIYLADGSPAKGAKVRLFPVNHLPDSGAPAFSAYTDDKGKYQVDSIARGEYNVLGEYKGLYSFADSVYIAEQTKIISQDTLGAPGSVSGIVGLQPNHDPITVTVQVLGTNAFANVESSGGFRIDNLARGTYTLRILTTLPEYTPLYKTIAIEGGKADSLKDTLWLPYTGIPVVRKIAAAYDTLNGVMHLSWKPAVYRNFSEYLVYRDPVNAGILSYVPIGVTTDSTYSDTLAGASIGYPNPQSGLFGTRYRYRVRIRSRSDEIGLAYDFAEVDAPPPSTVTTAISAGVTSVKWDAEKQVDSTEVAMQANNPGRGLAEITWALGRPDSIVATTALGGQLQATSRLKFGWAREGIYGIYIKVKDVGGTVWNKTVWVMSNRAPQISLTWPDSIWANAPLNLHPQIYDPDGDKLRITASGLPKWMTLDSLTGALRGIPTNQDTGLVSGLTVFINDGRRTAQAGPANIFVRPNSWSLKPKMPFAGSQYRNLLAVSLGDSILVLGHWSDHIQQAFFYPVTGKWSKISYYDLLGATKLLFGQSANGRVFVFCDNSYVQKTQAFIFDPATSKWSPGAASELRMESMSGAFTGEKILLVGQQFGPRTRILSEYDPAGNAWTVTPDSDVISVPDCFWSGGKLYSVFGIDGAKDLPISLDIYDPAGKQWSKHLKWPDPANKRLFSLVQLNGKAYTIGGYAEWYEDRALKNGKVRVDAFDLKQGTSTRMADRILPRGLSACVENQAKLFCFGGISNIPAPFDDMSPPNSEDVEEFDPPSGF